MPCNGTEMAYYVLMCRQETAHSLLLLELKWHGIADWLQRIGISSPEHRLGAS